MANPTSPQTLQERAAQLARHLLVGLSERWDHTRSVADAAARASAGLSDEDGAVLVAAAWLHDIGYSQQVAETGFHALDGANELLRRAFPSRVADLVAHHSMAVCEAEARKMSHALGAFCREQSTVADALTWADMTTGRSGDVITAESRIAEILVRYPPHDPVHRGIQGARSELLAAVGRTEVRLGSVLAGQPM